MFNVQCGRCDESFDVATDCITNGICGEHSNENAYCSSSFKQWHSTHFYFCFSFLLYFRMHFRTAHISNNALVSSMLILSNWYIPVCDSGMRWPSQFPECQIIDAGLSDCTWQSTMDFSGRFRTRASHWLQWEIKMHSLSHCIEWVNQNTYL